MTIHIENLRFQCILGILDFERTTPQDVIINLELSYTYKNEFINYAELSDTIKHEMKKNEFLLIEDALSYLIEKLKKKFSLIEYLNLKITKPSILPDCMVSVSDSATFIS